MNTIRNDDRGNSFTFVECTSMSNENEGVGQ